MFYKFIILTVSFALFSCVKVKDKSMRDINPELLKEAPATEKVRYEGLAEPNKYIAQLLEVPSTAQKAIRLRIDVSPLEQREIFLARAGQYTDRDIVAGGKYNYSFLNSEGRVLEVRELQVPRDLVFDQLAWNQLDTQAQVLLQFSRIFFKDKEVLTTGGRNFRIVADELIANNLLIQSFAEGAAAVKEGRGGGRLEFEVRKLIGSVRFEMRGEDGGQGEKGRPRTDFPGTAVSPGKLGTLKAGSGGIGIHLVCDQAPKNGEQGVRGFRGFSGGVGFRGGSSGDLVIKVQEGRENIVAQLIPGQGGPGGEGGAGGPGGIGGLAYDLANDPMASDFTNSKNVCQLPSEGPRGLLGTQGDRGPQGKEGKEGQITWLPYNQVR